MSRVLTHEEAVEIIKEYLKKDKDGNYIKKSTEDPEKWNEAVNTIFADRPEVVLELRNK